MLLEIELFRIFNITEDKMTGLNLEVALYVQSQRKQMHMAMLTFDPNTCSAGTQCDIRVKGHYIASLSRKGMFTAS